jgi:hypothetical protein
MSGSFVLAVLFKLLMDMVDGATKIAGKFENPALAAVAFIGVALALMFLPWLWRASGDIGRDTKFNEYVSRFLMVLVVGVFAVMTLRLLPDALDVIVDALRSARAATAEPIRTVPPGELEPAEPESTKPQLNKPESSPTPSPEQITAKSLSSDQALQAADAHEHASRRAFSTMDLSQYANSPMNWLLNPLTGKQSFYGVPYRLGSGDRAVLSTSGKGYAYYSARASVPVEPQTHAKMLHVLVSGTYVPPANGKAGTLQALYNDGTSTTLELRTGVSINETWQPDAASFNQQIVEPPADVAMFGEAYREPQMRGSENAVGRLFMLSVKLDAKRELESITIERDATSEASIALVAATLELAAEPEPTPPPQGPELLEGARGVQAQ